MGKNISIIIKAKYGAILTEEFKINWFKSVTNVEQGVPK